MDLHALSLGRAMLLVRGIAAFTAGVWASNNPGMTVDGVIVLLGLWTLVEGAALVRQAYPPTSTDRRAESHPALMALGSLGVAVGALTILAPGLSNAIQLWVLASWFVVRAVAEGLATAATKPGKARVFLGLAILVDLGLAAVILTHTSGTGNSIVLFGGALISLWGLLHLGLAVYAGKTIRQDVAVSLLAPR